MVRFSNTNNAQDYYPFGMLMPGRQAPSTAYKYGFNGKEKDDEVKGAGNSLDFGARIHDPRLGRFLSLDPLSKKFVSESNYSYAGNSPITMVDREGERKTVYLYVTDLSGKTTMVKLVDKNNVRVKNWYNSYEGTPKPVYQDVTQSIFYDMSTGKTAYGKELLTPSNEKGASALIKAYAPDMVVKALDDLGVMDGEQKFGYYIVGSGGVNSQVFADIKGKAEIVEVLDAGDLVMPDGGGNAERIPYLKENFLKKIAEKSDEINGALDAMSKAQGFYDGVNKILSTSSNQEPLPDTLLCPAGCKIPVGESTKGHSGEDLGFDTIKAKP